MTPEKPVDMRLRGFPDQHFGCISYAQHGDDFMVLNLFKLIGIERPSYLDLGAHHPQNISNTKLLYDRGSRGVNVEANPNLIATFRAERPGDTNLNLGVGPVAGEATFFMYSDSSGRNTFSAEEVKSLEGVLEVKKEIRLGIVTLDSIVDRYCKGAYPAFLSCDIEGLDFGVLSGASFDVNRGPVVICVETRRHETSRMRSMLDRKGFFLYCRMGENLFFVNKKFHDSVY